MTKNYIIQAHKNPLQLKRLIEKLNTSNSFFFIHIDLKSKISAFKTHINLKNVTFIEKRVNCIWADYSQVTVTLNLIEEVLKSGNGGYVLFLSGQDYPIKSNNEIDTYLKNNSEYDFINFDSKTQPVSKRDGHFYSRLTHYKINLSDQRNDFVFVSPTHSFSSSIFSYIKPLLKKTISLKDLKIFSKKREASFCNNNHFRGSNWWGMRVESIKKIFDFYTQNKQALDTYYRYTFCPDEQFFQTVYQITNDITQTKEYLHYINWNGNGKEEVPIILKTPYYDELISLPENYLFARKFDINKDSEIINLLDKHTS